MTLPVADVLGRVLEHLERLLEVDDVDPIALAEDVLLHARIPTLGLVSEVDAGLKQLLHGDGCQTASLLSCIPYRGRGLIPIDGRITSVFPLVSGWCYGAWLASAFQAASSLPLGSIK